MKQISIITALSIFTVSSFAQRELGVRPTDTGGPLMFEQAVFDVQNYDISIKVDPKTKSISGTTVMTAKDGDPDQRDRARPRHAVHDQQS